MNPWKGLGGLPRPVWVVFTATLINRAGTMVLPFLVLYLTRSLGFSTGRAALAVTVYGIGSLLTGPVAGRLSDRIGPLAVLEGSLFISGCLVMLIPLVSSPAAIMALVFLWAVTADAFRPAAMSHLTGIAGPGQGKLAVAVLRLAVNLGMSVGPAVGGVIAMWSFPALFVADGATSILAGLVMAVSRTRGAAPAPAAIPHDDAGAALGHGKVYADGRFLYFLIALLPVLMVFFQHQAAMPLYLVDHLGMPEVAFGLMFTLNTVMIILIEVPLSAAMSAWPHRLSLALGALLVAAGFGLMALASGYPGLAATVVIWTFGEMLLLPTASAYVADIAPPARRGEYMGYYATSFGLAFTAGPWIGAALMERWGPSALWIACFGFGCLSAALLERIRGRRHEAATPADGPL